MCQKLDLELMKLNLFNKGFVIFLKGATFSDFIETRLLNYKPLAIRIHFPLFWRIFFSIRFKPHQVVKSGRIFGSFEVCIGNIFLLASFSSKFNFSLKLFQISQMILFSHSEQCLSVNLWCKAFRKSSCFDLFAVLCDLSSQ